MALRAIILNSIKLLLRSKAPMPLLVIIAIAVPVSSYFIFTGDGTLSGVLKMMITYNYYIMSSVLMLLTLYLSSTVLDSELREEQITLTSSKPVARWKILLGKWVAVCIVTGIILAVSGVCGYFALTERAKVAPVVKIRKSSPDTLNYTPSNFLDDAKNEIQLAYDQVLTARRPYYPVMPPVEDELEKIMTRINTSQVPEDKRPSKAEVRMIINRQRAKKTFPVPYGAGREFEFVNLPVTDKPLKVRYTLNGSRGPEDMGWLQARWLFSANAQTAPYAHDTDSRSGTTREFNIPGNAIGKDGNLRAVVVNISGPTKKSPAAIIEVPAYTGIRILIPDSGFALNYFKSNLLLWIRLIMIAAIGVSASAYLSGSVASFLLFSLIICGSLNKFVAETVTPRPSMYRVQNDDAPFSKYVAATILKVLPDFEETSPVQPATTGTLIPWSYLSRQFLYDVIIRGGIFFIIGIIAFNRREIGIPRIFR